MSAVRVDERTLNAIQAADPDGGETEPTDAAYADHERWAVATFGRAAWVAYTRGGWDDPATYHDDYGPRSSAGMWVDAADL